MTKPTKTPKRRRSRYTVESTRPHRDDHKRKPCNPGTVWKEIKPWEAILGKDRPSKRAGGEG